jgi:hypothetical protein
VPIGDDLFGFLCKVFCGRLLSKVCMRLWMVDTYFVFDARGIYSIN